MAFLRIKKEKTKKTNSRHRYEKQMAVEFSGIIRLYSKPLWTISNPIQNCLGKILLVTFSRSGFWKLVFE